MELSEPNASAVRPAADAACVVMVCAASEADQIGRQLSELNSGCLITYRRVEDLIFNAPTHRVALVILANCQSPAARRRTLRWLRHRWPACPITVVGDSGCDSHEMAARQGGAQYLTRPVPREHWSAILSHATGAGETDSGRPVPQRHQVQ